MARIVMKFGGTSVGTPERMLNVARRAARVAAEGNEVVIVVSAMSGETNRLISLAESISETPDGREVDVLLATGEQVSIALVALALQREGLAGRSFSGVQAGIVTDTAHTKARIRRIDPTPLENALKAGQVPVVAGFQGATGSDITTLGRGGSVLTAVAIAAALKADVCEIYTDVDGVYTTDPNIVQNASKLSRISFEEMLELASLGAKVLQSRSVELAMKEQVPLHVRSSFSDVEGTWVTEEVPEMEDILVSGIAYAKEAKLALRDVPDAPGVAAKVFMPLAAKGINVDMIVQNVSLEGETDLTFTLGEADLPLAVKVLEDSRGDIGWQTMETDREVAKISVVGVGMRSHAGVAAKMFDTLAASGVNIQMISTSEIKISVVVDRKYLELAVRELHRAFGLERAD
jgi:aspartate kinase